MAIQTKPILVIGATGQQGGAVARALLAKGQKVRVMTRHLEKAASLAQAGAEIVQGDLTSQVNSQEMAKLKGAKGDSGLSKNEIASIRSEVTELRQMITSLAINVENMKDNYVHVSALEDRMMVGE